MNKMFLFCTAIVSIFFLILGCSAFDEELGDGFPCYFCEDSYGSYIGEYGSFSYGGQTYKTVVIGTQNWMAENLNYKVNGSVCYDNSDANCATYGRLYNWETAMKICPPGWYIPNNEDWTTLFNYVGGSSTAGRYLKATSGWNYCGPSGSGSSYLCEDTYEFAALPGGYGNSSDNFYSVGSHGYWWSASEYLNIASNAYRRSMTHNSQSASSSYYNKNHLFSVRCLQEIGEISYSSSSSIEESSSSSEVSSSSSYVPQNWCVYYDLRYCFLADSSTICPDEGLLALNCPYSSSSGNSSSSTEVVGNAFIDQRDGKAYKYEIAPNGRVWMSENLNYSRGNTLGWCYGSGTTLGVAGADLSGCEDGYGRAYTYEIAIDKNSPQGLCPDGWHIPSKTEWNTITYSNMSNDFYASIRAGDYGTNATYGLGWKERDTSGFYWTSNSSSDFVFINIEIIEQQDVAVGSEYFSVRCIMDVSQ